MVVTGLRTSGFDNDVSAEPLTIVVFVMIYYVSVTNVAVMLVFLFMF